MTKVIFFGTPHFAAPILREIINSDLKVVTVFTQPPKKSNRGQKISKSEIHLLAEKYNLNIKTPDKLIDEENYLKNLSFLQFFLKLICLILETKNDCFHYL